MIEVGERAPDFAGIDDEGNRVSEADLRGRPVLVHFFVVAWSGV